MAKGPDNRASIVFDDEEEEVAMSDWSGSTIAVMKEELRERGLPVSGSHADLVERLEQNDAETEVEEEEVEYEEEPLKEATVTGVLEALGKIVEALDAASRGQSVTIHIQHADRAANAAGLSDTAPGTTEMFPTVVGKNAVDREMVRDAARRLLSLQPDGRARALNILAQYGGSVSSVPDGDLERCHIALEKEIEAVAA